MTTHYSRRPYDFETGCSGLECVAATAFDHAFVALWIGLAALLVLGLVFLPTAREVCETERRRSREEADAFGRFVRRVERIDTAPATVQDQGPAGTQARTIVHSPQSTGEDVRAVRDAYRETVMAVSHYEVEYDEPLAVNVAEEFDPEAAVALASGDRLTPQIERALVQSATDAREGREELVDAIDAEIASLEGYEETLAGVERSLDRLEERPLPHRSFEDLRENWAELQRLRTRTEDVLADRQREIQSGRNLQGGFPDPWAMYAYIYQSIPTTHPVLREGTRLVEAISSAESRVARSLSRRV